MDLPSSVGRRILSVSSGLRSAAALTVSPSRTRCRERRTVRVVRVTVRAAWCW